MPGLCPTRLGVRPGVDAPCIPPWSPRLSRHSARRLRRRGDPAPTRRTSLRFNRLLHSALRRSPYQRSASGHCELLRLAPRPSKNFLRSLFKIVSYLAAYRRKSRMITLKTGRITRSHPCGMSFARSFGHFGTTSNPAPQTPVGHPTHPSRNRNIHPFLPFCNRLP